MENKCFDIILLLWLVIFWNLNLWMQNILICIGSHTGVECLSSRFYTRSFTPRVRRLSVWHLYLSAVHIMLMYIPWIWENREGVPRCLSSYFQPLEFSVVRPVGKKAGLWLLCAGYMKIQRAKNYVRLRTPVNEAFQKITHKVYKVKIRLFPLQGVL